MSIFSDIAKGISGIIGEADKLFTSDDERNEFKQKIKQIEADTGKTLMELESKFLDKQSELIKAEMDGSSWLQRNWRPLLMMVAIFIIFNNYVLIPYTKMVGLDAPELILPEGLWNLLTVSVGGYVVGRSYEKGKFKL